MPKLRLDSVTPGTSVASSGSSRPGSSERNKRSARVAPLMSDSGGFEVLVEQARAKEETERFSTPRRVLLSPGRNRGQQRKSFSIAECVHDHDYGASRPSMFESRPSMIAAAPSITAPSISPDDPGAKKRRRKMLRNSRTRAAVAARAHMKASKEADKTAAEEGKETAMNEAQQLSNENADLHKSCDFVRQGAASGDERA